MFICFHGILVEGSESGIFHVLYRFFRIRDRTLLFAKFIMLLKMVL